MNTNGGVLLHVTAAGANRHDAPLLGPTLASMERIIGGAEMSTVHLIWIGATPVP